MLTIQVHNLATALEQICGCRGMKASLSLFQYISHRKCIQTTIFNWLLTVTGKVTLVG